MQPFRLGDVAEWVGGTVEGDPDRLCGGVQTLAEAGPDDLSFLTNPRYQRKAAASRAGAVLTAPGVRLPGKDLVVVEDPYYALAELIDRLYPAEPRPTGVHPSAILEPGCEVAETAYVGAYSVIGSGAAVGEKAVIHPHVVVGPGCRVGAEVVLYPQVVLYADTVVGDRSIIHSGVVLGSDGYGFATHGGRHHKIRQVGRVVVGDDVEIGANTAVDRAALNETVIGDGTKIDNLVQVGHNVRVGRHSLLVSQSGIAGSTRLGEGVVLAGQAGVSGHLELGDGVVVSAKSAVFKSVAGGQQIAGIPAVPTPRWLRQQSLVSKLDDLRRRLRRLERLQGGSSED